MSGWTTTRVFWTGLLIAVASGPMAACGTERDHVLTMIRQAGGSFRAISADDVSAARREVRERMEALDRVLNAAGANGQAWKQYLLWDQLWSQVEPQATPDPAALARVLERYSPDQTGIELPSMLRLRTALQRYRWRLLATEDADLAGEYERHRMQLAELVALSGEEVTADTLQKISLHLNWLDQREQIPEVVAAVRKLAPQGNLRLCVSQEFIADVTREPIDRVDPLTDTILGTTVHGTSYLRGTIAAVPVDSQEEMRWAAQLRGDASTQGRGYHGPVRAHVVGSARVRAEGEILFGPDGFRVGQTRAHVAATGSPTALWTTCGKGLANALVTCMARRRAAKTQELADYIASRHAEQRLREQLGEELQARLEPLQESYLTRFRNPLLRYDAFPRLFEATSDAEGSHVELLLAAPTQLGAPRPAAPMPAPAAWSVCVHESAVNNLADRMLAGRTVSELQIREFVSQMFGGSSDAAAADEATVLHIVFADERPVTVRVADSVLTVQLRASSYIVNRRKYAPMNVTLRYRLQAVSNELLATREGEPDIQPPDFEQQGSRRLGSREIAARRLIATMLERELDTSYRLGSFQLPPPAHTYGPMVVTSLTAHQGWLTIAANRASVAPHSVAPHSVR